MLREILNSVIKEIKKIVATRCSNSGKVERVATDGWKLIDAIEAFQKHL